MILEVNKRQENVLRYPDHEMETIDEESSIISFSWKEPSHPLSLRLGTWESV